MLGHYTKGCFPCQNVWSHSNIHPTQLIWFLIIDILPFYWLIFTYLFYHIFLNFSFRKTGISSRQQMKLMKELRHIWMINAFKNHFHTFKWTWIEGSCTLLVEDGLQRCVFRRISLESYIYLLVSSQLCPTLCDPWNAAQ